MKYFTKTVLATSRKFYKTYLFRRRRWWKRRERLNYWFHDEKEIPADVQNEIDTLIDNDKQLESGL